MGNASGEMTSADCSGLMDLHGVTRSQGQPPCSAPIPCGASLAEESRGRAALGCTAASGERVPAGL